MTWRNEHPLVGMRVTVNNYWLGNTAYVSGIPPTPFYSCPGTISAVEMIQDRTGILIQLDYSYTGQGYASGNSIAQCWISDVRIIG